MRQLNQAEEAFTIVNSVYPFSLVCVLRLDKSPSEDAVVYALGKLQVMNPFLSVSIRQKKDVFWFDKKEKPKPISLQLIKRNYQNL